MVARRGRPPDGRGAMVGEAGRSGDAQPALPADDRLDRTGVAYVSDPNGVVVAASRPALVGERADQTKFASALSTGRPGFARYRVHGTALTAAYGPVDGFLGWHAVVQQSAGELLGPV